MATATTKSSKAAKAKKVPAKKPAVIKFVPPEVEEGTWQDTIVKSAVLKSKAEAGDRKAGDLLWSGAQQGINDWLDESSEDVSAEGLYNTLLALMGKARKGDASKIRKVAVAVADKGLILSSYANLSKAYKAATELIDAAPEQDREDHAAEDLSAAVAESAPKSTASLEGAAKMVIGAGIDEASRVLVGTVIDAAGSYDKAEPVLRALLRAMSQEVAGVKPKPEPKAKAPAKPKGETVTKAKAAPKDGAAKTKATPKAKPAPVEEIEDAEYEDIDAPDTEGNDEFDAESDLLDEVEAEDEAADDEVVEVPVKTKASPVVRRR